MCTSAVAGGQLLLLSGTCPNDNASRFLPTRVFGRVWLLLLKVNHPNDDASRFFPTRAIGGVVKSMVKCKICTGIQKSTSAVVRVWVLERGER